MSRLLSVNVGLPRDVSWNGKTVRTSVWKSPVDGRRIGCAGSISKVMRKPISQSRRRAPRRIRLPDGLLTITGSTFWAANDFSFGHSEKTAQSMDLMTRRCASAIDTESVAREVEVTQPRVTCYRVGIRMNEPRMPAPACSTSSTRILFSRVAREKSCAGGGLSSDECRIQRGRC